MPVLEEVSDLATVVLVMDPVSVVMDKATAMDTGVVTTDRSERRVLSAFSFNSCKYLNGECQRINRCKSIVEICRLG